MAVFALAAVDVLVIGAWSILQQRSAAGGASGIGTAIGLWAGALAVMALSLVLAIGAARMPDATQLRWDGAAWRLGPGAEDDPAGELSVMIDLGGWQLLRFIATTITTPATRRRVSWLPVQRRGLEAEWHALRRTVHTARAMPAGDDSIGA